MAASFKSAWTPLVNTKNVCDKIRAAFKTQKLQALDADLAIAKADFDKLDEQYGTCLAKISELLLVRALSRPLPKQTTRAMLCEKAMETVSELQGSVAPNLVLHISRAKEMEYIFLKITEELRGQLLLTDV